MERGYRDVGRSSLMGEYEDYRGYGRQGGSSYLDRDPPVRESYLGSPTSSSYRSGRSSYSSASGMDRDLVESILQQQALQRQLNLRESQLALANSLLQQQHQQDYLKRHMDPRDRLSRDDFKRPRMMDPRSRHRSRSGSRDSITGGRGSRGSSSQGRNQSSPRGRGRGSSGSAYSSERQNRSQDALNAFCTWDLGLWSHSKDSRGMESVQMLTPVEKSPHMRASVVAQSQAV